MFSSRFSHNYLFSYSLNMSFLPNESSPLFIFITVELIYFQSCFGSSSFIPFLSLSHLVYIIPFLLLFSLCLSLFPVISVPSIRLLFHYPLFLLMSLLFLFHIKFSIKILRPMPQVKTTCAIAIQMKSIINILYISCSSTVAFHRFYN